MRRVLYNDGVSASVFHYDHSEKKVVLEKIQDVEPILENNKRLQNEHQNRDLFFRRKYSIPLVLVSKWLHEDGVNFLAMDKQEQRQYLWRKIARNPDYRYLITTDAKL